MVSIVVDVWLGVLFVADLIDTNHEAIVDILLGFIVTP